MGTFPIGIEPMQFVDVSVQHLKSWQAFIEVPSTREKLTRENTSLQGLKTEGIQNRLAQLEKRFEGVKVIVGVDRLDYIKGVPQKLHALEVFLTQHPEWIGKVVLVQLAIPSRQDVEEYQNLRAMVNELVGRINGRFGTVEFMPIHFMHTSVPFQELTAMYALADACLITSTRDGMNLVAYEYIASQQKRNGTMILSEYAGAAQSLNGSLIINPWDVQATADAIHAAVTMDKETRASNWQKLYKVSLRMSGLDIKVVLYFAISVLIHLHIALTFYSTSAHTPVWHGERASSKNVSPLDHIFPIRFLLIKSDRVQSPESTTHLPPLPCSSRKTAESPSQRVLGLSAVRGGGNIPWQRAKGGLPSKTRCRKWGGRVFCNWRSLRRSS